MDAIEVDGSIGEGGGQILRTAVAFSAIVKKPVRVFNIRAGRPEPGLRNQHATALRILAEVFGGELSGASLGSSEVRFSPGDPKPGSYSFDTGTAASITLVLQAVVPAVSLSGSRVRLDITGGTDVPWSPTFDYFRLTFRSACSRLGIRFDATATRRGFYPRGGGKVSVQVEPTASLSPVDLTARPSIERAEILSMCGGLPRHVAERQLKAASSVLEQHGLKVDGPTTSVQETSSPGSAVLVTAASQDSFIGADSLGAKGRPAEAVGEQAASNFLEVLRSGACVDPNLADMIVPWLSLAGGESRVRTSKVTDHLRSGIAIAQQFTGCDFRVEGDGSSYVISATPARS